MPLTIKISVSGVDKKLWREFRAAVILRDERLPDALNACLVTYLAKDARTGDHTRASLLHPVQCDR